MRIEFNQSIDFKPIAICLLLDGKAALLEHDATGGMFTRGTSLEPTVHVAREGKHFVQIAMWMHGAGPLKGYAFQVVSSHGFVLGGPGEGALRISLIDGDALSNPADRLDIRWVIVRLDPKKTAAVWVVPIRSPASGALDDCSLQLSRS
jgi:hypothetical protein